MPRLFARADWRLAAAGTLTGVLTALLVLLLWVRSSGGALTGEDTVAIQPLSDRRGPGGRLRGDVARRLAARRLPARPLTGTLALTARNVTWRDPGSGGRFVTVPALAARIDAAAANRFDIVLGRVSLREPRLELVSNGRTWNYERPLAGLLADDGPSGERQVTFRIGDLAISGGTAHVVLPGREFTLQGIEARLAQVELAGPGLAAPRLLLEDASAELVVAGADRNVALAAERGELVFPEGTTEFDLATATVAGIRLEEVQGVWDPAAPGYGVTATGVAPAVELARLQFLAPERLPESGTARFRFAVEPRAGEGTAVRVSELEVNSGDSRATGRLSAEVYPGRVEVERVSLRLQDVAVGLLEPFVGPLPYAGTVSGTVEGPGERIRLDLSAQLAAKEAPEDRFGARVTGAVSLTGAGLGVEGLRAELRQVPLAALRALAPGLPLAGLATGTVELRGSPASAPLEVAIRLELGSGLATLAGTVDLTGTVPRYDLSGRLVGVRVQQVVAPAVPPVTLTGRFTAAGTGFDPATATARLRLDGGLTGWRAQPGDTVVVVATVSGGELQVSSSSLRLAGAAATVAGNWRFVEPVAGAVQYRLAVADLGPFGPFLPVVGDSVAAGSLRAEGTVSGPLAALRLAGTVTGSELRSGEWSAARLSGAYAVRLGGGGLPDVEARFRGENVGTAGAGSYRVLQGDLRLVAPVFRLDMSGEQAGGGEIALVADGTVPRSGARSVLLQRAHFDLPEGRWQLAAPARVDWGDEAGVRISDLRLRNAATGGVLEVAGTVLPLAQMDARVVVADLPLDQLQDLLGRERRVGGRLWADLAVRPPGSAPRIQGSFRLDRAELEGVSLARVSGRIDYAGSIATVQLSAAFDSAGGRLELRGALPLRIALADSVSVGLADSGPVSATLTAERVSVEPLGLLLPRVRNLGGVVDGTVNVSGTVANPLLAGQLSLSGGRVTVPELNQRFDSIAGLVTFAGRTAELRDLRVRQEGWARVNGTIVFEELDRPVLGLAADLDGFRPMGVADHPDAAVDGRVTVTGELDDLLLSGRVVISDGYLAVPQLGAGFSPDYLDAIDPTPVLGRDFGSSGGADWLTNLRIQDLRATFGEGAWVEAFDATLQLRGNLDIDKTGDDLRLTGTLTGERGTYTLAAGPVVRRFEITQAQVRFLGSAEPNPAVDITARRVVLDPDGRRVEVEVRITGTARTPRLALASADAPNIPESELLSFLLFGRRTLAFGETFATTGELVFEQTIFGGVAEVVGLELERALSANLGLQLDLFQVRFGHGFGGLTTPTFVLGRQVANDFFITVESALNALFGDAGAAANSWAVRLEWAISPLQTLELGYEPLNRARLLRGIGAALPPGRPSPQQLYAEYRRRWVY